jgi:beta-glucanase (GH16 family)
MTTFSRWRPHARASLLAAAAALAMLSVAATCGPVGPASAAEGTDVREITFFDDFGRPNGAAADPSNWILQGGNGTRGWGNRELQWYTKGTGNAAHDGRGHLVITARKKQAGQCWDGQPCAYTSAKLLSATRFTQTYGHIEARIRFDTPPGVQQGFWPAFWALEPGSQQEGATRYGEIDLMENYGTELVQSSLHGSPNLTTSPLTSWHVDHDLSVEERNGWHIYAVDWTPDKITFSIDGQETGSRTKTQFGPGWTFDRPFFLVLNVAVGGTGGGNPTPATSFPLRMLVDYVSATA